MRKLCWWELRDAWIVFLPPVPLWSLSLGCIPPGLWIAEVRLTTTYIDHHRDLQRCDCHPFHIITLWYVQCTTQSHILKKGWDLCYRHCQVTQWSHQRSMYLSPTFSWLFTEIRPDDFLVCFPFLYLPQPTHTTTCPEHNIKCFINSDSIPLCQFSI